MRNTRNRPGTLRRTVAVIWTPTFALACGGAAAALAEGDGDDGATRRDTRVEHEPCDTSSPAAQRVDVNADGKPDITSVVESGRVVCRGVDLNFDGVVDSWQYNDAAARVRRREADYDRDGRIDEISIYRNGVLVEKHRATTLAGRLDTWHFYENDKLARTERDSDGDARVDQWWEYLEGREPKCPLIHSDVDGDGRPDPGATVDACGEGSGYVPPEQYGRAAGATDFGSSPEIPTEVQEQAAPDESSSEEAE